IMGSSCDIHPMNIAYAGRPSEENSLFSSPKAQYVDWMKEFTKLSPQTESEKLVQRIEGWNQLNGQVFPLDVETNRRIHMEFLSRHHYPQGILNHIAMLRDPRSEELVR